MDPHQPPPTPGSEAPPMVKIVSDVDSPRSDGQEPDPNSSSPLDRRPVTIFRSPSRLRWWTPFAISLLSLAVFIFSSVVMAVVAVLVVHGEVSIEYFKDPEKLAAVSRSRWGLFIMVVMPQFALVIPAMIAAKISPIPMFRRLGLVRGGWPLWAWAAAAAATPLVGLVSSVIVGLVFNESESLKEMSQIFRDHGANGFLFPLAMMIGATPAVCEELLFRGYVQTRLTRSFHPAIGILLASGLFAVFHLDFVHVIAVFPMGLFLGWISWRSGSLFPAMLGHFVNNVISVFAVVLAPADQADVLAAPMIAVSLLIIAAGLVGMGAVSAASVAYGPPQEYDSLDNDNEDTITAQLV